MITQNAINVRNFTLQRVLDTDFDYNILGCRFMLMRVEHYN
jgi:hypothetical protein